MGTLFATLNCTIGRWKFVQILHRHSVSGLWSDELKNYASSTRSQVLSLASEGFMVSSDWWSCGFEASPSPDFSA